MKFKNEDKQLKVIFLVVLVILLLLNIGYILVQKNFKYEFGVEQGSIARSIATGRGFSNPFGENTGPTAWMPPLLPLLISFSFKLFGVTFAAFVFLSILKMLAFAYSFVVILKSMRISGIKIYPYWYFVLFITYFLMFPNSGFVHIDDTWLNIFVISLFIYSITFYIYEGSKKYFIFLACISFISSWVNPCISLALLSVLFFSFLKLKIREYKLHGNVENKKAFSIKFFKSIYFLEFIKLYSIIVLCFVFSLSIWGYRNYIVFGKIVPVKSNLWFEFYLSNIVDNNGILSISVLYRTHPIFGKNIGEIKKLGEIEWLSQYENSGKRFIQDNPELYLKKVVNRFKNVVIFTESIKNTEEIKIYPQLSESDKRLLNENCFIHGNLWITHDLDEKQFITAIQKLNIKNKILLIHDWKNAKDLVLQRSRSLSYVIKSVLMATLPLICIITMFFIRRIRKLYIYQACTIFYFLFLLPYIFVSHYTRYQKTLF